MNKNTYTTVKLEKGEMNVYDFGGVKLHAYKTNDFIDDEVFVIEKNGKAVVIESPCFFDNCKELSEYLKNLDVEGILLPITARVQASCPTFPSTLPQMQKSIPKTETEKHLSTISQTLSARLLTARYTKLPTLSERAK